MWLNITLAQQITCPPQKICKKSLALAKRGFAVEPYCFEKYDCLPVKDCDDCIMHMKWKVELNSEDSDCDETDDVIPDGSILDADLTYHIRRTGPAEGCEAQIGTHEGRFTIKSPTGVIIATGILNGTNGGCCNTAHYDKGSLNGTIRVPGLAGCKLIATYESEFFTEAYDACSYEYWKNWSLNIDGVVQCNCPPKVVVAPSCKDTFKGCWNITSITGVKFTTTVCVTGAGCGTIKCNQNPDNSLQCTICIPGEGCGTLTCTQSPDGSWKCDLCMPAEECETLVTCTQLPDGSLECNVCIPGEGCEVLTIPISQVLLGCFCATDDGKIKNIEEVTIGTWICAGASGVRINFDKVLLKTWIESECQSEGMSCTATPSNLSSVITLIDNNNLKGTMNLALRVSIAGLGSINLTFSGNFTGVKTTTCAALSPLGDASNSMLKNLAPQILSIVK